MPEIIETTVYQLAELDETAKDKARAWFREGGFDHDWYDAVYTDFEQVCAILGVTFKTRAIRLLGGGSRQEPCIYFRGFWSQGDGACFEGRYTYARGAPAKIAARRCFMTGQRIVSYCCPAKSGSLSSPSRSRKVR